MSELVDILYGSLWIFLSVKFKGGEGGGGGSAYCYQIIVRTHMFVRSEPFRKKTDESTWLIWFEASSRKYDRLPRRMDHPHFTNSLLAPKEGICLNCHLESVKFCG